VKGKTGKVPDCKTGKKKKKGKGKKQSRKNLRVAWTPPEGGEGALNKKRFSKGYKKGGGKKKGGGGLAWGMGPA